MRDGRLVRWLVSTAVAAARHAPLRPGSCGHDGPASTGCLPAWYDRLVVNGAELGLLPRGRRVVPARTAWCSDQ